MDERTGSLHYCRPAPPPDIRPSQIQKSLGAAPRSLLRWRKQLDAQGSASFYQARAVRGAVVLSVETSAQCQLLLDEGHTIATSARLAGIKGSTLRKAIAAGRITKPDTTRQAAAPAATDQSTKSQRSSIDAQAAAAIGTACTRADERTAAAFGLAESAATRFEPATDLMLGGVLCGLASPVHDRAITLLLDELTSSNYFHPETGHRLIYQLV